MVLLLLQLVIRLLVYVPNTDLHSGQAGDDQPFQHIFQRVDRQREAIQFRIEAEAKQIHL
jgi:hypothetical protein